MILTLVIIAALATLLIAISLPLFGWGSGIDAAGRGMAMFLPVIAMTVRIACLGGATIALASDGSLAWTGMSGFWAGACALLLLAILGLSSFIATSALVEHAPPHGSAASCWIASIFMPLVFAGWLIGESEISSQQVWAIRGLAGVFAVASILAAVSDLRSQARRAAAFAAEREKADRALQARVAALPADADLGAILAFLEALPEDDQQARDLIKTRAVMLPDRAEQTMAMLADPDRTIRLRAGRFSQQITMPDTPAYYAIAEREIAEIIERLESRVADDATLFLEARAALGLAWPAMQTPRLKKSQMTALHNALIAQGDASACRALAYEAGLLKDYVTG